MRRISFIFGIILFIELFALISMVVWIFCTVKEQSELAKVISSLLFSFGSLLLTTSLVYHHFWLHPELRIIDIIVDPRDVSERTLAEAEYRSPVWERRTSGLMRYPDNIIPKEENGFKVVKGVSSCSKMRISTDVCNIGGSETTIHQYQIREIKPRDRLIGTYVFRRSLPNERRETVGFYYSATSGEFEFEITVFGSTVKASKRVKIIVSDDLRTIKWKEYDC